MTKKEKDIKRLIKHIAKEDTVPFLGSGFSLKAGAPSVWNLKEAIVEDGGPDFSYYSKTAIKHTLDKDGHFVFQVDETKLNGSIPIMREANLMMTRNDKLGKVVLYGKSFLFNYLITIYKDITLTKCEQVADNENLYLTDFKASTNTEEILVVDNLPDFYREGANSPVEEGVVLYYKPGEREKYGIPEPVMIAPFPSSESTKEQS